MNVEGKARRSWIAASALLSGALCLPISAGAQAKITGKVTLEGTPPAPVKLKMDADPVCAQRNPNGVSEEVVVGPGGGLQNVFVRVTGGLPAGQTFPAPKDPVVLDQNACKYVPHVVGLMVGQPLKILNSDGTLHNVHGMPKKNAQFNFAMPKFVKQKETTFTTMEAMIAVKCDVHPWMSGYIGVVDNPFFAVTGADGTFTIQGLPAGEYTVEAWQEKYGTQSSKVKVDASGAATADFKFKAS